MYAVGWNWLQAKATEGMVAGESKRRGKQIGRSAGACMLWGGIGCGQKQSRGGEIGRITLGEGKGYDVEELERTY